METDWWGKYTSGILIETYIKSMELFTIVFCRILHGWMEEYKSWIFTWYLEQFIYYYLFGNPLSLTVIAYVLWIGRKYSIHFLVVLGWNCYITTMHTCYFIGESSGSNGINFGLEKETRWKVGIQYLYQGWNCRKAYNAWTFMRNVIITSK